MPKKYKKKTRRSRRKSPQDLDKTMVTINEGRVQLTLPLPAIEELAVQSGLLVMRALMEGEVEDHAGAPRRRSEDRAAGLDPELRGLHR